MDKIEIPFGAYDSETLGWTYTIPKGYTAKIEDGKIVVKKEELEDERIRKWIYNIINSLGDPQDEDAEKELEEMQPLALAYLEKQKEQKVDINKLRRDIYQSGYNDGYQHGKEDAQKEQKPVEIHIDNPNIHKVDPDVKISTSDSSAGGDELLYVSNKSYNIGYRDGVASVKPSWKPSEEQMQALMDTLESMPDAFKPRCTLETLQNDLKKLI